MDLLQAQLLLLRFRLPSLLDVAGVAAAAAAGRVPSAGSNGPAWGRVGLPRPAAWPHDTQLRAVSAAVSTSGMATALVVMYTVLSGRVDSRSTGSSVHDSNG